MKINILSQFFDPSRDSDLPKSSSNDKKSSPAQNTQCPNCEFIIQKEIKSKTKCPNCHKDIYVRVHYKTNEYLHLTEVERQDFEEEERAYYFSKKWFGKLKEIGVTDSEIEAIRNELRQKWGPGYPSFNDLVWALFNKQVIKLTKRHQQPYHELKMLYFTWGLFSCEIDNDPNDLLKQSHKWKLMDYKSHDFIKGVEILSNQGCEPCNKLNGKKYSLEEALSENSVLPNKECIHKLSEKNKYAWCRCIYSFIR